MHDNPVNTFNSLQDLLEVKAVMKAVAWAMRQLVRAFAVISYTRLSLPCVHA